MCGPTRVFPVGVTIITTVGTLELLIERSAGARSPGARLLVALATAAMMSDTLVRCRVGQPLVWTLII
jgi:hypothetical protein